MGKLDKSENKFIFDLIVGRQSEYSEYILRFWENVLFEKNAHSILIGFLLISLLLKSEYSLLKNVLFYLVVFLVF